MGINVDKNIADLISIIIPVYNVEQYLSICLDSVCHQTYTNLEIILVDDASTDTSGKICDEYAKHDERVHVVHLAKNGGLSNARNIGLHKSKGDYLGFVDSDDCIHMDMYNRLYSMIKLYGTDIAVCGYSLINAEMKGEMNATFTPGIVNLLCENKCYELIYLESRFGIVAWNKLYKKQIFDEIDYPVGKTHEDNYIIHRIIGKAQRISYCNDKLYFYRIRNNSITNIQNMNRTLEDLEACRLRIEYFKKEKIDEYIIKAQCEYMSRIISIYYTQRERIKLDKNYGHILRQNYQQCYDEMKYNDLAWKNRFNYFLFLVFPKFGAWFQHIVLKIINYRKHT